MISVIVIGMMINGLFVGQPARLQSLEADCRSELMIVQGMNQANESLGTGIGFVAICIRENAQAVNGR